MYPTLKQKYKWGFVYFKTSIECIKEENFLPYLKRPLRRKFKFYVMVHLLSKITETNEEMVIIIENNSLMEIEDWMEYIASKLVQCQTAAYQYNTLLVLNEDTRSSLFKKGNGQLCRLLTKTGYFNMTCIIAVQTLRFVHLNAKRLTTDIIC